MAIHINNDWKEFFDNEQDRWYYWNLRQLLATEYKNYTVYPPAEDIFNAFKLTPKSSVKVVILGQDPYHGPNQAMGLSFSVRDGIKPPPSLKNILKEIELEGITPQSNSTDLTRWAKQGVFLLNTTLTVREHEPNSHYGFGWFILTDEVIRILNDDNKPKVFMLWGNYSRAKKSLITNPKHLVLESAHPSPLSAHKGFFGNNHFTLANEFLIKNNIEPIQW